MNNKVLLIAASLVLSTSLVMIGSIAIQPAEAGGAGCAKSEGGGAATTFDPNAPNAVNTKTPPQLADQTV
jgi:hypothetical protein